MYRFESALSVPETVINAVIEFIEQVLVIVTYLQVLRYSHRYVPPIGI